jgi:hypothetical protein
LSEGDKGKKWGKRKIFLYDGPSRISFLSVNQIVFYVI